MPNNFFEIQSLNITETAFLSFIGFFSLTNQQFTTYSWTPYIFVSVISYGVWAVNYKLQIKFHEFRELRVLQ